MTDYMKEAERLLNDVVRAATMADCHGVQADIVYRDSRAALLAHIQHGVPEGWKEATIAWEVCASIHREYAKKKDPFFTTRQADFVRHTEAARAALLAAAPAPAEVPMPEPDATLHDDGYYVARHSIRSSYEFNRAGWRLDVLSMATARTYGAACRAAGEAVGYARGREEAGRDADRYSFLRGDGGPTSVRWPRWEVAHWTGNWNPVSGKELDAAIDAALRGEVK